MRFVIRRQGRGRVLGYTSPSPAAGGNADQINAFLCEYKKKHNNIRVRNERERNVGVHLMAKKMFGTEIILIFPRARCSDLATEETKEARSKGNDIYQR